MKLMLWVVGLIPPALLRWLMRWRFNGVRQLAPMSLARPSSAAPVLLLDVRTRDEFDSGHLPSAIHVAEAGSAQRLVRDFRKNTTDGQVVAYCTVGYRSAQFAEHMASVGCAHVENLEGGIWAWAAAGQPIIRATKS